VKTAESRAEQETEQ